MITSSRLSKMTLAPFPFSFDEPSTYSFHHNNFVFEVVVNSGTKSVRRCALISPLGSYLILNFDNSIYQPIIRPTSSGFFRIIRIG